MVSASFKCGFRQKKKVNNLFIHLNLCIALTLGLIVFIAGIETATKYRVSSSHSLYIKSSYLLLKSVVSLL